MKTVTISARLESREAELLEEMARAEGSDRSTLIKAVLRRGLREMRLERAAESFRLQQITLSRAAEMAGVSQWDFIALTDKQQSNLHYDVDELAADLDALAAK